MQYVVVGLAGIVGALLRYDLGLWTANWWHSSFPLATLLTNLSGCFVLGWLTTRMIRLKSMHPYITTALGTGLVGSFTTFSTFSVEAVNLMKTGHWGGACFYVLASGIGGLLFSWFGYKTGNVDRESVKDGE